MKYYKILTYGCQMNVHESEKLSGIMESIGYQRTEEDNIADVVIFNTCCIRDNAERKALGNITSYKQLKKKKPSLALVVLGCMTQQENTFNQLKNKYPYVDIVLGNHNKYDLEIALKSHDKRYLKRVECDFADDYHNSITRDNKVSAWISIIQGCNNYCSYCIVPYVRGREKSREYTDIINEAKRCIDNGYKEITLLGQNVNSYGKDLYADYSFSNLLSDIASINAKFRINYMTSHPKDFNKQLIRIIRDYDNVTNYIHLPIQSGSNKILHAMNRGYTKEKYLDIIDSIRSEIPSAGITTDLMVGFPGESEEDFMDTLDIVNRVGFTNAFMFIYSKRSGTPASEMQQIDENIKKERINRLIKLQRETTLRQAQGLRGSTMEVLAEDNSPRFNGMLCGRSYDGRLVHFSSDYSKIGDFVNVGITSNKSAALIGKALGENNG